MHAVPERRRGKRGADAPLKRHPALEGVALEGVAAVLDDDGAPLFSVGQVAQLVGLRPWFLRRLDSMAMVTPTRSGGDHRRYSRADIRRLLAARALMRDGVSVAGIRRVFELEERVAELEDALRATQTPGDDARQRARRLPISCNADALARGGRARRVGSKPDRSREEM